MLAAIKGVLQHRTRTRRLGAFGGQERQRRRRIIGSPPLGVIATNSIDVFGAGRRHLVIYAPLLLPSVDGSRRAVAFGQNVVTPLGGSIREGPLEVAAQAGNATLHGAGIGPGLSPELFRCSCR